ncbi:MAG: hypothetical protein QM783_01805 [Phycisphaerales bacterium]
MSDVRVSALPLALAGSVLVHLAAVTGLYLAPASTDAQTALAQPGVTGPTVETTPLYLIPDELPPEIAAKIQAERDAEAAKAKPKPTDKPPQDVPPPPPKELAAKPPELEDPVRVQLGAIDGPKINTKTWMKNDAPGEHSALLSETVQPQQDKDAKPLNQGLPGQGGADGKTAQAKSDDRVAPEAPAAPRPGDGAKIDAAPRPSTADTTTPALAPPDRTATDQPVTPVTPLKPQASVEQPMLAEPSRTEQHPAPRPPAPGNSGGEPITPAPQSQEPKPAHAAPVEFDGPPMPENFVRPPEVTPPQQPIAAPRGGTVGSPTQVVAAPSAAAAPGSPGNPSAAPTVKSDRESDAANVKVSGVFRNGKVEAGEGLDIRTVRPDISLTTRALRQPRSPTLEIVFGKDGRARSVRVLKSSGLPSEIDEPVINALYNWRARGRVLDELPSNPDSSVSLEITILFQ